MKQSTGQRAAQPPDEPRIEVPEGIGETAAAAIERLRQLELVPALEERDLVDEAAYEGLVVGQVPRGGDSARRGDIVTLFVGRSALVERADVAQAQIPAPMDDDDDDWYELPSAPPLDATETGAAAKDASTPAVTAPADLRARRGGLAVWRRIAAAGGALAGVALVVVVLRGSSTGSAPPRSQTVIRTVVETVPSRPTTVIKPAPGRRRRRRRHASRQPANARPATRSERRTVAPVRQPTRPSPSPARPRTTEPPPGRPAPCELCFEHP